MKRLWARLLVFQVTVTCLEIHEADENLFWASQQGFWVGSDLFRG
jgi:hypothetical protein